MIFILSLSLIRGRDYINDFACLLIPFCWYASKPQPPFVGSHTTARIAANIYLYWSKARQQPPELISPAWRNGDTTRLAAIVGAVPDTVAAL